jgi:4'-phosphopantetheinyl transferase EntD
MPLFFQQYIDQSTRLAAWKIEEDESWFLEHVPLQREITHPHKRLQHLAGRYLLKKLFPEFPVSLIQIADTRKPFLEGEAFHFSISHCADYAAALVSRENRVGIDLEKVSQKVERVGHKFISEEERPLFDQSSLSALQLSTLIWSCKEAVFKWYGTGEVDFREHMHLKSVSEFGGGRCRSVMAFKKKEEFFLTLENYFFADLCLSFVIT